MKKQREQRNTIHKHCDFNSVILAGRPATVDKFRLSEDQYSQKLKQIKALKKFQQLFRKDIVNKQFKFSKPQSGNSIINERLKRKSPHEANNRLKGMFFLRKKADLLIKYPEEHSDQQASEKSNDNHALQGKTLSPVKQNKQKQKKLNMINPHNFVNTSQSNSGKLLHHNIITRRPNSQLDSNIEAQKIFNNRVLYMAILGANKVKLLEVHPSNFVYFSVYVQEGNNSQLIKAAVRKRSGWKVVQIPTCANMIWSQFYRKNLDVKIKYKSQQISNKSSQQPHKQLRDTFTNLPGIIQTPLKKRLLQKQIEKNPNMLSMQQFNNQIKKICPKYQHLHRKANFQIVPSSNLYFYNHIPNHHLISDKTHLLRNLRKLYESQGKNIFNIMPFSLDISSSCQYNQLLTKIQDVAEVQGYWIVKPGQNSNRGRGIVVCKGLQSALQQINSRFGRANSQIQQPERSPSHSFQAHQQQRIFFNQKCQIILQKYIQPLLYFKRKFDIRMYLLVTMVNNKIRGYVYEQGYIRTSSKIFSMETFNKFVHLTNDAIQSRSTDYGKFEQGNKVSWKRFQKWLEQQGYTFWKQFRNDYKNICKDILQSVKDKFKKTPQKHSQQNSLHLLSAQSKSFMSSQAQNTQQCTSNDNLHRTLPLVAQKRKFYFEVFGLDFLIDHNTKTWLIQVNTNPAITTDCSRVVNSIVPQMIDNAFTIAVQPYLKNSTQRQYDTTKFQNNFQVIFDDEWDS